MSSMGSAAEARAILYPYQRRWIDDQSRFKIGMFSRQTGKTYTSTLEIAEDMVKAEVEKRRVRWVILSRGERQAREAMEEGLKVHLRAYGAAFESLESDFHLADATSCKSLEVVMAHGSRVTALPANPDTARGFSANVFLDEFAFHADSRKIWAALFPVVSRNGLKLRVVSTPNGKGNKFYDLMTSAETAGWSKHVVDIYQAVADGLPRDVEALRAALNDPDAWAQEYELQWLDEASAWLSYDLINAVEHERAGIPQNYAGGPCYVGVDIGRRHDLFVIWVLEEVGDVLWTRELVTRRGASFAEQAFEDRRLRIPQGDEALRSDLHKLQKVASPTGAPRFVADSDSGGHADRAWACFLAVNAATGPAVVLPDHAVPSGPARGGLGRFTDPDAAFMPYRRMF